MYYVDYINEVLNETVDDDDKQNLPDDWEEGLTFTAKSSRKYFRLITSHCRINICFSIDPKYLFIYIYCFSVRIRICARECVRIFVFVYLLRILTPVLVFEEELIGLFWYIQ